MFATETEIRTSNCFSFFFLKISGPNENVSQGKFGSIYNTAAIESRYRTLVNVCNIFVCDHTTAVGPAILRQMDIGYSAYA